MFRRAGNSIASAETEAPAGAEARGISGARLSRRASMAERRGGEEDTGDEERRSAAHGKLPATVVVVVAVAVRCGFKSQHRVP